MGCFIYFLFLDYLIFDSHLIDYAAERKYNSHTAQTFHKTGFIAF